MLATASKPDPHPYDHELPAAHEIPGPPRLPAWLDRPLWLAAGVVLAGLTVGSPGCTATGGPAVSAKGEVSVKEVSHLVASNGGPVGGKMGGGPTGEFSGSISFQVAWPSK